MSDFGADRRDEWQAAQQHGDPRRGYAEPQRYDYDHDQRIPEPRDSDVRYSSLADLSNQREGQSADWSFGGSGRQDHLTEVPRGPRSGEPLPPLPPPVHEPAFDSLNDPLPENDALREPTGMVDSAAVRRSVAETDGLYRSQRPVMAVLFGTLAVLGEVLSLRALWMSEFAVGPLVAMAAFPMVALGLYAVTTGAATAVQFQGPRVWLRTPLIYLPIGIALLIAAL